MALIGINPGQHGPQKKDTLDKIQQGFGIASQVLGTAFNVADFVREGKESKLDQSLKKEQLGQEKIKTDVEQFKSLRPGTQEEIKGGLARAIPGSRVFGETPVVPRQGEVKISDYDKKMFDAYTKDFRPATPGEKPDFFTTFGGKNVGFVAREDPIKTYESQKRSDTLRKEFLREASDYKDQTSAYQRITDSAKNPSPAGDLALIFNYMKVLDPGSTVREGEFATAENSGAVPNRVFNMYNKLLTGERLAPEQRIDFVDRATRLYKGAKGLHDVRVKYYSSLAEARDLPIEQVIVPISANLMQAKATQEDLAPTKQESEEF